MAKIIFDIITYLFAIYGVFSMLVSILNSVRCRIKPENSNMKLVLIVKNQEENIEGVVRNILDEEFLRKMMLNSISVIDLGSADNTMEILLKLKQRYENLEILDCDKKDNIFEGFDYI